MPFMVNLMTLRKISILAVCLFVFLLPIPENSYAFEWQDLWQTRQQQAQQEYLQGNYQQAAEQFTDPAWQAAARYKADKKLAEDEQMLAATTDTGFYNQGNVLAKSGQLEKAIESYEQALKLNPDNQDAQYNKELVEKELEKQKQQQQNKDQDQDQDQDQDPSDNQQEQQDQQGDQSEEQSGQQQSQDAQDSDKDQQQDASAETEQQDKQNEQQKSGAKEQDKQEQEAESAQPSTENIQDSEQQQASEQWLRRIPDDPSGLLKRKFKYQYGRQKQRKNSEQQW